MQMTVIINDELLAKAREATGIEEQVSLIENALQALIYRAAARDLIALGGSDPNATAAPRRKFF
ncbi:MAG: type II toxin-antitoxin system VapB family antitoxin [Janthinobacterium lividum]